MSRIKHFVAAIALIVVWGCGDSPTSPSREPAPTPTTSVPSQGQPSAENPPAQPPPGNPAPTPPTDPPADPPADPPVEDPPTGDPTPTPPPNPPAPTPPSSEENNCKGLVRPSPINGSIPWGELVHHMVNGPLSFTLTNHAPHACDVAEPIWKMPVKHGQPGWTKQTLLHLAPKKLAPGASTTVNFNPPCGTHLQLDIHSGVTAQMAGPNGENIHPENLVYPNDTHALLTTSACAPPPPPPPPPAPTCEAVGLKANLEFVNNLSSSLALFRGSASWKGTGSVVAAWGDGSSSQLTGPTPESQFGSSTKPYPMGDVEREVTATFTFTGTGNLSSLTCQTTAKAIVPKKPTPPPPPPPLPCVATNPPNFTANGTIIQTGNKPRDLLVRVTYGYSNRQNERVGIWWENGGDKWMKKSHPVSVKCEDGPKSGTLEWTGEASGHLPSNGARYYIMHFTGSESAPNVISKVEIVPTP